MLWNDLSRKMPALLMTMSTLPYASTAVLTMLSPPSGVATESVFATCFAARCGDLVDDELRGALVAA